MWVHLLGNYWSRLWPNMVAAVVSWVSGLAWAKRRVLQEWERQEAGHLRRQLETHALIQGLSDQIGQQAAPPEERNSDDDPRP